MNSAGTLHSTSHSCKKRGTHEKSRSYLQRDFPVRCDDHGLRVPNRKCVSAQPGSEPLAACRGPIARQSPNFVRAAAVLTAVSASFSCTERRHNSFYWMALNRSGLVRLRGPASRMDALLNYPLAIFEDISSNTLSAASSEPHRAVTPLPSTNGWCDQYKRGARKAPRVERT